MNKLKCYKDNFISMRTENIITKSRYFVLSLFGLLMTTPAIAGWEVNYIDTFSGNGVNWQNWTAQIDANFNNEVLFFV